MSAAARGRDVVSSAVAAAGSWLIEPPALVEPGAGFAPSSTRPVIAVFGLRRGCGASVVARALAAGLASRDAAEAGAVSCGETPTGVPLASRSAARLAGLLAAVPGAQTRAVGRLCLVGGAEPLALADTVRHHAPLVLDAGSVVVGGAPAAVADRVVLVGDSQVEPALAAVIALGVARVASEPLVVLNRVREEVGGSWAERAAVALPWSRMGAQLALGGREPRGSLGEAIGQLAELCEA